MSRHLRLPSLFVATMLLLIVAPAPRPFTAPSGLPDGVAVASPPSAEATARVEQTFGQLPLYFVENQGQMDERVAYYVQGSDKTLYFSSDGVTFALTAPLTNTASADMPAVRNAAWRPLSVDRRLEESTPLPTDDRGALEPAVGQQRWTVKLDFIGANPDVRPIGLDKTEAVISYFKGPKEDWHTGLPTYSRIVYLNLWPGIDLVYYGTVNRLKYEFIVHPGADPAQIRLAYRGATEVVLNAAGQLAVTTPAGGFSDDTPVAYQEIDGRRTTVAVAYALHDDAPHSSLLTSCGFRVGDYDPSRTLVLDPAVIVYCGYIGGSGGDYGSGIAVDGASNAYITGWTDSDGATFPVTVGPDLTYNGGLFDLDAFVAKIKADGTGLAYCGYIGGSSYDEPFSLAVDAAGNAYVAGGTYSTEATFPVTIGPDLTFNGGSGAADAFVAKVKSDGTGLAYCGYIGGAGDDWGKGIAVDEAGNAYVTGDTLSSEAEGFPVAVGPDLTYNSGGDAFVAKVKADGTELAYCGYIGGDDSAYGITVDRAGNAYIIGDTTSTEATFPVTVGPALTPYGPICGTPPVTYLCSNDAFVAKVKADGAGLAYCGYIGGSGQDDGYGIAVDGAGNAYVTGYTDSSEATFPVTVGPDLTYNGGSWDAFVAKVRADGTGLAYCGYIGGASRDGANGIAVDGAGNAYLTGETSSTEATFPVTVGPDLTYNGGDNDAFVAKVNASGTSLAYCGYIGGSAWEGGKGIAVDATGNAYITGGTHSTQATFPVRVGPDLTYNSTGSGVQDAFVAKVSWSEGPFSISGRVTDGTGNAVPNVTVSAGAGGSDLTDANGTYTLIGLITGTYTIAPAMSGFRFAPMTRTVNVPPNGTADFIMRTAIPTPFLAPPITGSTTSDALRGSTNGAGAGRVNAWFDHVYPIYGGDTNNIVRNHVGITVTAGCGLGSLGCYNGHSGTDFRTMVTATDNPIYAAAAGVVTNVVRVDQGGYGIHLWIDHENGYATLYGHLRAGSIPMTLTNGTRVVAGQQIGIMGNTGQSTGTHLHLGVYYDANGDLGWTEFQAPNEVVDPFGWMLFPDRPSPPDPWPVPSFYLWRYRIDSQTAAGASGAVLSSPSDTARVNVPPGALVYTVTLQLMDAPPVAGASAQLRSTGRSFWLRILEWLFGGSTSGLVLPASDGFAQPLTITMNYSDTDAMHLSETELAIYRWNEASSAWVALPTSVDTVRNQALAETTETGNFDLQAPLICPAGAEEPNDNYYAASLLPPNGTPQSQLFDIATDEDWFRLEATAGGKYVIQTSNLAAGVDTILEVFDQDGLTTLASDDNGGGNAASRLEWHAPASGMLFIRVAQAPGSAYGCSASYDISVSQELWVYLPIALRKR